MADQIFWIDADGTETPLSAQPNFKVLAGMRGRFMPPIEHIDEEIPFQHGSRHRQTKVKSRDVDIPLDISAASEVELRNLVRFCLRMINPLKSDGKIKVIAPDGSQREIYCRYSGGMEGNEDTDAQGVWWQKVILVFRAFDPFWYDSVTTVQTFTTGETATFFPFFPLRLSSASVFADTTVDNQGDVEAFPEWIINGPASNIILRNLTTGEILQLDTTLDIGESVTVDTKPGAKTVKKNDGTNLYYTLSDESSLWALQEGVNGIRLEMSGSTDESSIQLTYRNRYWGP